MHFWKRKSSPKEVKTKGKKQTLLDTIHEKFKNYSKHKGSLKSERGSGNVSERSFAVSRSALPSAQVSRCQSFADSGVNSSQETETGLVGCCHPLKLSSLSRHASSRAKQLYGEGELATTASVSTDSTLSTDDVTDSQLISPQASDYESATRTAINSPSSVKHKDLSMEKEQPKLLSLLLSEPVHPSPPKQRQRSKRAAHVQNLQIPSYADFCSAPTSMKTSPSRSPVPSLRHNSVHLNAVETKELQPKRPHNGRQEHHRLPVPPLSLSVSSPFSPPSISPSILRSPARAGTYAGLTQRWKKGRLIGRGTFGEVYLGFNSETGEMCAMKEVTVFPDDAKSTECAEQICQEISLLSSLRHPNIVQYYGSESVDDKLYIYLEYVSGGSIHKLLQEYGQLGEAVIRSYTLQILSGLAYLHAKNTVHRDIKGANILVDPSGRVKLADFGMAKHISVEPSPLSFRGSPYWMAPEVIKNSNGYNLSVDIWSLGCTVLEMATAKPPWSQYEGIPALFKIGNSKELPSIPDHLSEQGKDFVRQCLQRNPQHRPSASELLEHPFVKSSFQLERHLPSFDTARPMAFTNLMRVPYLEQEKVNHRHRSGIISPVSSDFHMPRVNFSCPVSPIGSPLWRQGSSDRIISPPSNSASGYCTPNGNPNSSVPLHIRRPVHEAIRFQRPENTFFSGGTQLYHDPNHEIAREVPLTSHVYLHSVSHETSSATSPSTWARHGQSALADRVSQKLVKDCGNPSMSSNQPLASQLLGETKSRQNFKANYH